MDIIASPLITVILNMVASVLVSKGILDSHSVVAFVQFGNNAIAGVMTFGVAVYSIYKMVELKKHQISLANTLPTATKTETVMTISQPISQPNVTGQSGLTTEPAFGTVTPPLG